MAPAEPNDESVAVEGTDPPDDTAEQVEESSDDRQQTQDHALDPPADPRQPAPSLIRHSPFVAGFFATVGALTAFFLLQQLLSISGMLVLLVIALFLAMGLNPLVEAIAKRGAQRGVAVLSVLLLVIAVFTLFVFTIAPVISDQITLITKNAPDWLDQLQNNKSVQQLDDRFAVIDKARDYVLNGDYSGVFGGVLGFGLKVLSAITNALIVLVLTVYFLASLPSIKDAGYRMAPASRRPRVRDLGDRVLRSTGAYVSGSFLVGACAGVSTLIFTFFVGLREYSLALAFIVGLLSLIPVIGAIVSAAMLTLIGLTVSPTVALICLVYYLAYQQFEQYVIYPRIMARAVDLPGVITVVAALLGGSLMGITGALLAVPTAAALVMLHKEIFLRRQDAR